MKTQGLTWNELLARPPIEHAPPLPGFKSRLSLEARDRLHATRCTQCGSLPGEECRRAAHLPCIEES